MKHREIQSWLMDMDGVLVHEERRSPARTGSSTASASAELPFLVLTNNSIYTRRDLAARLAASGLRRRGGGDLDLRARDGELPRQTSGPAAPRS